MADGLDSGLTPAQRDAYDVFSATLALTRLPAAPVARLGGEVGWTADLPCDYTGTERQLWLVLPPGFPLRAPMAFVDPAAYRAWPHAMRGGRLCLWREGFDPVGLSARDQAGLTLQHIRRILAPVLVDQASEELEAEFAREWLAYWPPEKDRGHVSAGNGLFLGATHDEPRVIPATCATTGSSRERLFVLLGGDEAAHRAWVKALDAKPKRALATRALFVPLAAPPIGAPNDIATLDAFLVPIPGARELLRELIWTADGPIFVVFAAGEPTAYAALELTRIPDLRPERGYAARRGRREQTRRRSIGLRVAVLGMDRADADWIHGRGFDEDAKSLRSKHVVLFGCGTFGGLVARALAAAGVGRLTLVDQEGLSPPNLGRHVLGARRLAQSKAHGLAEEINAQLPHIRVEPHHRSYHAFRVPEGDDRPDLVISTTAAWPVDRHLLERFSCGDVTALQLAWAENHALAGHAVIAVEASENPIALFANSGQFLRDVSMPSAPLLIPGCDGAHQPGTFNRMQRLAGMAVEQSIDYLTGMLTAGEHRCWIGDARTFRRLGVATRPSAEPPKGVCERTVLLPMPRR